MPAEMKISDAEKLILLMLCELFKALKIKSGEIDPEFVEHAIFGGHFWGLEWKYPGIFQSSQVSQEVVTEVVNILDMWSFLERSYAGLPNEDKERVAAEAHPYGSPVHFDGFDGNNETEHMSVARFIVEKLDRFSEFDGRDFNSHSPKLDVYRRMLSVFEPIRSTMSRRREIALTASEIIEILKARTHPSYRNQQSAGNA